MAHKVFICHSSTDKAVADAACAALEAQRIPCWIAPRDILAGEEYGKSIVDALASCQIVLLVFSAHANGSPQVRREIERAVSKGKIIVPFRIEDVLPSDAMEFALSNTHWLDALTPPLERYLLQLCDSMARLIQKHRVAEAPLWKPQEATYEEAERKAREAEEARVREAEERRAREARKAEQARLRDAAESEAQKEEERKALEAKQAWIREAAEQREQNEVKRKTREADQARLRESAESEARKEAERKAQEAKQAQTREAAEQRELNEIRRKARGAEPANGGAKATAKPTVGSTPRAVAPRTAKAEIEEPKSGSHRLPGWAWGGFPGTISGLMYAATLVALAVVVVVAVLGLRWLIGPDSPPSPPDTNSNPAATPAAVPQETLQVAGNTLPSAQKPDSKEMARKADALYYQRRYAQAAQLYNQTCASGNADDCFRLAYQYQFGQGVAKSDAQAAARYAEAARLYDQACVSGNANACNLLGTMNESGEGVAEDPARAAGLYSKACDGGEAMGCDNIDRLHRTGRDWLKEMH